jgi:hypothetical protein
LIFRPGDIRRPVCYSLIDINSFDSRREWNFVAQFNGKVEPTLKLFLKVRPDPQGISLVEICRGYDFENASAQSILIELELTNMVEGIVVHVHRRPGYFRPIARNKHFLNTMALDIPNDRMMSATP